MKKLRFPRRGALASGRRGGRPSRRIADPRFRSPRIEPLEQRRVLSVGTHGIFPGEVIRVGDQPYSVAVGDFNGDQVADLVTADVSGDTVSVVLGLGDGTFHPRTAYPVGDGPMSVAVGDFNGDGAADLVTADYGDDTVSVLLGRGDGTFAGRTAYAAGPGPKSVAVGHFNADQAPDLVTADSDEHTLSVLLGHGDGTFQAPTAYGAADGPQSVAVADFNGDGAADLVTAGRRYGSVLLGRGDGAFDLFSGFYFSAAFAVVTSVAVGDLDADGTADLASSWSRLGVHYVRVFFGLGNGRFEGEEDYKVGHTPISVAIGDFNGDGAADLVTADSGDNTLSVLLGDGDGTFASRTVYAVGDVPVSVAVGDFNADGAADLVTADSYDNTLSVFLGHGDGTFGPQTGHVVGHSPVSVAVGDFNADGAADVVTADYGDDTVSVLLGHSDGTFEERAVYAVASHPNSVAVGDFNGDGAADLVTAGWYDPPLDPFRYITVSVLLGNREGTFAPRLDYTVTEGDQPRSVAVADFNGDGDADLVMANSGDDTVLVLFGHGDGTFEGPVVYAVGSAPVSLAVGDFNGDRVADLVTADSGDNTLSVLLNHGGGTFEARTAYVVNVGLQSVAVADFNGDGVADLVTAGGGVSVLLGNRNGTFQTPTTYPARYFDGSSVAVADFNADGAADLVLGNAVLVKGDSEIDIVPVLLGHGDGTFEAGTMYTVGHGPHLVAVGEFNADGTADLVVTDLVGGAVSVLFGHGDGTFPGRAVYAPGWENRSVAVGDFNADGAADVVTATWLLFPGDCVSIVLGHGDGMFGPQRVYPVGSEPFSVAVADFNRDRVADLVTADHGDNTVSVLLGHGDGTFAARTVYAVGDGPKSVAVGDFNADGAADLVTADYGDDTVSVLVGHGDGTFGARTVYAVGSGPRSVALGDFNADGAADLATADHGRVVGTVSVLLGDGDGTFAAPAAYAVGNRPHSVAVADFNGDGAADLVTADFGDHSVSVLLGDGHGTFQAPTTYPVGHGPRSAAVADFNADGAADLVTADFGDDTVSVLLGRGDGTFEGRTLYAVGERPWSVAVEDFNADGMADLVTADFVGMSGSVLLNLLPPMADFGDAPAPYPTLLTDKGARHTIVADGPILGENVDAENDGKPHATAEGDDLAGVPDDEDGVVFLDTHVPGHTARVSVSNGGLSPGELRGWIDFDHSNTWDPGEQIIPNGTILGVGAVGVVLTYTVPRDVDPGITFARFRISSGGDSPIGEAVGGEVEDYLVELHTNPVYAAPYGPNNTWNVYEVCLDPATWVEADGLARGARFDATAGHLASIHSDSENSFVRYITGDSSAWIGLTRGVPEDNWLWTSGEPFTYNHWAAGEPNNAGAGEDAVHLNSSGSWNDNGMGVFPQTSPRFNYVIEYETHLPGPPPGIQQWRPPILPASIPGDIGTSGSAGATEVYGYGTPEHLAQATELYVEALAAGWPIVTGDASRIIYHDPDRYDPLTAPVPGLFGDISKPFVSDHAGDDDYFQVGYKGRLQVSRDQAGLWTIGVRSDDGFGLRIGNAQFNCVSGYGFIDPSDRSTIMFPWGTGDSQTLAVVDLAEGEYAFDMLYYEIFGRSFVEVFAAPGAHANVGDTQSWLPIGDPGGLQWAGQIPEAEVVGRHVFYNNSAFDGNNPLPGAADDNAIAPNPASASDPWLGKEALLPGETANFQNYTSYTKGINGIMVDIANLAGTPTAVDFQFNVGNNNDPAGWPLAPAPTNVTVRPGEGTDGSDRVTLIWPDNAIGKQWLQVTVLATAATGLTESDVFYFGNAIGESGNSAFDAKVEATDMLAARDNPRGFLDPAPIDFFADFNRDARVDATDMLIARNSTTHFLNALKLITVPAGKSMGGSTALAGRRAGHDTVLEQAVQRNSSSPRLGWLYEFEEDMMRERSYDDDNPSTGVLETLLASF